MTSASARPAPGLRPVGRALRPPPHGRPTRPRRSARAARLHERRPRARRPFRDETGVRSVPAGAPGRRAPTGPLDAPAPRVDARGRGEAYWRREAERVRERVRALATAGGRAARADRRAARRGEPRAHARPARPRPGARLRRRLGRGSRRSSGACASSRTTSPTAHGARRAAGLAPVERGAVLCSACHAGDPGRARRAPLRRRGRPRPRAPPARPARGPPRAADRSSWPAGASSPSTAARSSARCAPSAPSTSPSCPTASASRAGARWRRSTTPSSRPASAATASWSPSAAASSGDVAGFAAATCMRGRGLGGGPDDAALDGRQLRRRQGRDQPPEGQEPDRRLPPAARRGDRPVVPRHAAPSASCAPGAYEILKCAVLGDRRPLRALARGPAGPARAGTGSRSRARSPPPAASRPRSWRRTSARAACGAC